MTRVLGPAALLALAAPCALLATSGQATPGGVPADKLQVAAVYENAVVTVRDVTIAGGEATPFRSQANDVLTVYLDGGRIRVDSPGGAGVQQSITAGDVVFTAGSAAASRRLTNLDRAPIRLLEVEIRSAQPTATTMAPDEMIGHEVLIDTPRVRVSRIALQPRDFLPDHTHPRGWLTAVVWGWPGPGRLSWHDAGAQARPIDGGEAGVDRIEIEVK